MTVDRKGNSMKLQWMAVVPALMGSAIALAPVASAEPNPGDRCANGQGGQTIGNLMCSPHSLTWINTDVPHSVRLGDSCDKPGAVTYGHGENLATCRGGTWQPFGDQYEPSR